MWHRRQVKSGQTEGPMSLDGDGSQHVTTYDINQWYDIMLGGWRSINANYSDVHQASGAVIHSQMTLKSAGSWAMATPGWWLYHVASGSWDSSEIPITPERVLVDPHGFGVSDTPKQTCCTILVTCIETHGFIWLWGPPFSDTRSI